MLNKLKKNTQGFTIIEVLIVLAIAGLIILIVLLAIPALQRNSRNTTSKNDASALAGAISEFKSNNDGAPPAGITGTGTVAVTGGAGTAPAEARVSGGTTPAAAAAATAAARIAFTFATACVGASSPRDVAVHYWVEAPGGGGVSRCVQA